MDFLWPLASSKQPSLKKAQSVWILPYTKYRTVMKCPWINKGIGGQSTANESMTCACIIKKSKFSANYPPLTVAVSPSGWAILCMAVAATHTGMLRRWPSTVADRSTLDTSRSTLGQNRHLMWGRTENTNIAQGTGKLSRCQGQTPRVKSCEVAGDTLWNVWLQWV